MLPIASLFDLLPDDLAGLAAVIAGLALFALLVAFDDRRKRPPRARAAAAPARPLGEGAEWGRLMRIVEGELARAPAISALQTGAAMQLDAAEHAFNAVLRLCAPFVSSAVAPTLEPARALVREPSLAALAPEPQPLAA